MSNYETGLSPEFGELGEFSEFGELGEMGEFGEFGEFGELGEFEGGDAHEQFLGDILGGVLGENATGLSEAQEVELATHLLEVGNEAELEQFLGNIFKKVVSGVGSFVKSPVGRALGGVLKGVAKKALPVVGGALGSMIAPGVGTAIGSKLGSMASGLFEVQTEGVPQEQAEFEVARRMVRTAAAAARHAAAARPRPTINPRTVARAAVAKAARQYAPGIYKNLVRSLRSGMATSSRPTPMAQPAAHRRPYYAGTGPTTGPTIYTAPTQYLPVDTYDGYTPVPAPSAVEGVPYAPAVASAEPARIVGMPAGGRWIRRGRKIIVLGV